MTRRPDHLGMHFVHGQSRSRPYSICHQCNEWKPIRWITKMRCLCSRCAKTFRPPTPRPKVEVRSLPQPPPYYRKKKTSDPQTKRSQPPSRPRRPHKGLQSPPMHHEQQSSLEATPETLQRWERNRRAVEQARARLAQQQDIDRL